MARLKLGKARRGVGLLEVSLGLAITALAMGGFAVMQTNSAQAQRAQAAGGTLNDVHEAARAYVQANRAALLSSTSVGGAPIAVLAGRTSAAEAVPGGSLQAAGLLPAAWVDRNSYGHRHVVLIRQPTAGNLEMMVIQSGGQAVRQQDLSRVASRAGAAGGFVPEQNMPSAPTTQVTGMGGGWAAPRTTWTSGAWQPQPGRAATYAFFPANASENGTFLSRVNTGNPDDTRMQTAINMNGNAISGAGAIDGTSLSTTGLIQANGNISTSGQLSSNGNINTNQWLQAQQGLWTGGQITAVGNISAGGVMSAQTVSLTASITEGSGCSSVGALARGPSGEILNCQGGQWRRPSAQAFSSVHANYWSSVPHTINNTNSFFLATNFGQVIPPGRSISAPLVCGQWIQGPEDSLPWCAWYQSTNIILYR
jgi:hypothetical protein